MNFDKDFVVHKYSTSSTQPSQSLLRTAYELIRDTHHHESPRWVNVPVVDAPLIRIGGQSKSKTGLVQYPPFLENEKNENENLREKELLQKEDQEFQVDCDWGAPIVEQYDVFSLEDLDEFESTDLGFLFNDTPLQKCTGTNPPRASKQPLTEKKKEEEEEEECSLLALIPQPHVHPSPSQSQYTPNTHINLIPYAKTKPILIPPRTDPFSPSPYSRSAWLVPICGKPPWEQCTAALMLSSSLSLYDADTDADATHRGKILWTPMSVRAFWNFLLEVRARASAGPIGVSFHASRDEMVGSQSSENDTVSFPFSSLARRGNGKDTAASATGNGNGVSASHLESSTARARLSSVDYIKIYHESVNAMHLRNMLHLWSYTDTDTRIQLSRKRKKIRVLKGAVLVLVDERSAGILLS